MVLVTIAIITTHKGKRNEALEVLKQLVEYSYVHEEKLVHTFQLLLSDTNPNVIVVYRRFPHHEAREQHNHSEAFKSTMQQMYDDKRDLIESIQYSYYTVEPVGFPCRDGGPSRNATPSDSDAARDSDSDIELRQILNSSQTAAAKGEVNTGVDESKNR